MVTFSLFILASFIFVCIATRMGRKEIDLSIKNGWYVRFTVKVVDVTFVMALGMIGTCLGLGIAAHLFYLWDSGSTPLHPLLYALAVLLVTVIYPVMLLIISMFDSPNKYKKPISVFAGIYTAFVIYLFYVSGLVKTIAFLGAAIVVLMIFQLSSRYFAQTSS